MKFLNKRNILAIFILLIAIGGLLFLALIDKTSGDCNRNKKSSITIGEDKVYCDHEGRMWSYTLPGTYRWSEAVGICEDLIYAKTGEWELPNISELEDLYNMHGSDYYYVACNNRELIDLNFKNNWDVNICTPSSPSGYYYWSSSEPDNSNDAAWRIFGYDGSLYIFEKGSRLSIRCIRKQ